MAGQLLSIIPEAVSMLRVIVALAYRSALPPGTQTWAGGFETALDLCRVHRAVQWPGRAPRWSPPTEHRIDWLPHALWAAERLAMQESPVVRGKTGDKRWCRVTVGSAK